MKISLDARTVSLAILLLVAGLFLANTAGFISKFYFDHDRVFGLVRMFDFNTERNVPTLFSCIAFVLCAGLLTLIATLERRNGRPYVAWLGLVVVFLYLSVDEMASLHETSGGPFSRWLQPTGFFYYAWVIPYGIALLVFVGIYAKFLMRLPRRFQLLFVSSGAIFVAGAVGMEMVGGRYHNVYGVQDIVYAAYYTAEELLELLGINLFIYTLMSYIATEFPDLELRFSGRHLS